MAVTSPAAWSCLDPEVRDALFVPGRPFKTKDQSDPPPYGCEGSRAVNSLVADGCIIEGRWKTPSSSAASGWRRGPRLGKLHPDAGHRRQAGAVLKYAITDKNVRVNPGRMLMGHKTYPLAIAKNEIV